MANTTRLDVTPRPEGDRIKAFELYLSSSLSGKYTSMRAIASQLGISSMTVARWRDVDKWDERIKRELAASTTASETTSNALKRQVRSGLLEGLQELKRIALKSDRDFDRIKAIEALAKMAIQLDAITAAATSGMGAASRGEFTDDLDGDGVVGGPVGGGGVLPVTETGVQENPSSPSSGTGDDGLGHSGPSSIVDGSLESAFEEIEARDEATVSGTD